MLMHKTSKKIVSLGLLLSFLLVGCAENDVSSTHTEMIEIENHGVTLSISGVPKRAVTLNQHVTEVMLALGLEEHMVGTAYLDDEILPEYKDAYESIDVLSDAYPSKEVFFGIEPDFAYAGWASAFGEDSLGTQEELLTYDIVPYLHESSTVIGATSKDIFTDIRNIGKIFRVEERAEQLITNIEKQIEEIQKKIPKVKEEKRVFVFDSGDTAAMTAGQNFMNELITMAGGKNIFGDLDTTWATVSWEEVVERDPEIIVIIDYGETEVEEKMEFLLQTPMLADSTAIKNEHFVVLPLSAAAEGVRIPLALEILVNGFYK